MTGHGNGLGQEFFDCDPSLDASTTTQASASEAAVAWGATSQMDATTLCGSLCWAGQKDGQCAVWCYAIGAGPGAASNFLFGRVLAVSTPACALACPFLGNPSVTFWPTP